MDISRKLRIIFWFLVVGLWGIFLYQYISEDLNSMPKIYLTKNPFSNRSKIKIEKKYIEPKTHDSSTTTVNNQTNENNYHAEPSTLAARIFVNAEGIEDIPSIRENITQKEFSDYSEEKSIPEAPENFAREITKFFVIYEEGEKVSKDLIDTLNNIHGNIMLDLIAFSPWQREKKVYIYFCKTPQTYQKLTGRPAWSGGAANSLERKIFLYESEEALGILAHELTHIYFDSFFPNNNAPLWLSEGMAVYIQVERANSYPRWLKENLEILKNGGGYKLEDIVRIENLDEANDKSVKLWYAQSYSLVFFLMKLKSGDAFYQFCKNIKDGKPMGSALYRAYGNPYNKISSLEMVWRYDLKTGKLTQINK